MEVVMFRFVVSIIYVFIFHSWCQKQNWTHNFKFFFVIRVYVYIILYYILYVFC